MAKSQNNNTPAQQSRIARLKDGDEWWNRFKMQDQRFCAKMEMIGGRFDL